MLKTRNERALVNRTLPSDLMTVETSRFFPRDFKGEGASGAHPSLTTVG